MRTVELKITNRTYQILWSLARQQAIEEYGINEKVSLVPTALLTILEMATFAGGSGSLDIKLSDSELSKDFPECSREELQKIRTRVYGDVCIEKGL